MITGMSIMGSELLVKRLDLLRQVRPQATGFAYLLNAANPGNPFFISEVKDAADQMGVTVHVFEVKEIAELVGAFHRMTTLGAQGLLIIEDPLFSSNSPTISELALQHQIPTVSGNRELPAAGGLLAYAFNYIAMAPFDRSQPAGRAQQLCSGNSDVDFYTQGRNFGHVTACHTAALELD